MISSFRTESRSSISCCRRVIGHLIADALQSGTSGTQEVSEAMMICPAPSPIGAHGQSASLSNPVGPSYHKALPGSTPFSRPGASILLRGKTVMPTWRRRESLPHKSECLLWPSPFESRKSDNRAIVQSLGRNDGVTVHSRSETIKGRDAEGVGDCST